MYRLHTKKISALILILPLLLPGSAKALSSSQEDVFNLGIHYFNTEESAGVSGSSCIPQSGSLPGVVPAPYNAIFTAAANKFNVPPAFLAALFYAGEHGSSWPTPPPPYGSGSPWKSSGVTSPGSPDWPTSPPGPGAAGPFQFEYPTWQTQQQDGNGDGQKDVEDLTDASFGSANYLASLGADTSDTQKLHDAAYHYNGSGSQATAYADKVMAAYQQFNSGPSGSTTATDAVPPATSSCPDASDVSAYQNPLRDVQGLGPARIDEGVDYTGDGPIYAIGKGNVSFAQTPTGWPGVNGQKTGAAISYKLSAGPAAGKTIYVAENCTLNSNLSVGSQVTANTVLCTLHNVAPFMEIGWAKDGTDDPMASDLYQTVPDGSAMAYGVNFSDLLKALGAPAGTYQFPSQEGNPVGTLPSGWPAW